MCWKVENLDAMNGGVVGVFIAPTTKLVVWWRLLSNGAPDSPVRQPRYPAVRVRPLELRLVGPLGCPVVHRTGPVDCPVRQLRVLCPLHAQARIKCVAVNRCVQSSRCSAGTLDSPVCHQTLSGASPDSPVNYSGAASHFPEGEEFSVEFPGALYSPVRQTRVPLGCL
jgi:hypothetical protein